MTDNYLYYGDNLDVLRLHIKNESVDLIYLDPPFNSNQDYNVLFEEKSGTQSAAQIKAFTDTWKWDEVAAKSFYEVVESGGKVSETMQSFKKILGTSDLMAYLAMMAPRLIELRRVLKQTGSIYLHCDPTASHYLKILMDSIFGPKMFCNEIIWHYRKWSAGKYTFQRNHDTILFYSKSDSRKRVFNQLFMDRAPSTLKRFGTAKILSGYDALGKRLPSKIEDEDSEGVRQDDVWDISRVAPIYQLFPTQKPEALLEKIIKASSNEGDIVLDPFCGCGTAIMVAQQLKRPWIGIDITYLAINLIKHRLKNKFGNRVSYKTIGEPTTLTEAQNLSETDPYQFQWWALGLVTARPVEQKKGSDKGIDGKIFFHDDAAGEVKQIILSVKGGSNLDVSYVRDLRGVIEREEAKLGVLITMNEPTQPMKKEAADAGFYKSVALNKSYPKIQILTIRDLLEGKQIMYPTIGNVTFKSAQEKSPPSIDQESLL